MQVVIIEDEQAAVDRLVGILGKLDKSIEILAIIDSVEAAIQWFETNKAPTLLFLDVQLSDGICFEIFDSVRIKSAIIFTTAYDQYAIQAFKLNSIDYLLKPVDAKELKASLAKFVGLRKEKFEMTMRNIDGLLDHLALNTPAYKTRFLVKRGSSFHTIHCKDIDFITIEHHLVLLVTQSGKRIPIDYTLNEIQEMLDPEIFFRINRQMIIAMNSIKSIRDYFNNRLIIELTQDYPEKIVVSRSRVNAFKAWIDR